MDLRAQDDVDYKNAYKDNDAAKLVELLKRPDKVTYDGYAVNTLQPTFEPHIPKTQGCRAKDGHHWRQARRPHARAYQMGSVCGGMG
jgi:hypothetical protein